MDAKPTLAVPSSAKYAPKGFEFTLLRLAGHKRSLVHPTTARISITLPASVMLQRHRQLPCPE
jgi:hypothetical protein